MITTRSNWHLTQIPPFQPITLVLSPQSADIKKVEKVSIMTRIHFPIAMPFCQSEFKVGPHFNQKLVCSSVLQRLYLICWKYARLQAAERFTAFCRDYQELFFFLLKRSQPDLPHFRLGGTLCVFFFFFGGGGRYITELKAPYAKSSPPSPLPSLSSSSWMRVQGTKVGAGRGHPMPNLCKPW